MRYYGDFRRYHAVGGKLEPLCAPGSRFATEDAELAASLYVARAQAYAARQVAQAEAAEAATAAAAGFAARPAASRHAPVRLRAMIELHLERKGAGRAGRRPSTVKRDRAALAHVLGYFGNCRLAEITTERLELYVAHREQQPGLRPDTFVAAATIRNELHAISNLFRRAIALHLASENPVAAMMEKPRLPVEEAAFLTGPDAGRLLNAAAALDAEVQRAREAVCRQQRHRPDGATGRRGRRCAGEPLRSKARPARDPSPGGRQTSADAPQPRASAPSNVARQYAWVEVVLAVLLYTGGRIAEVLGLLVEDVDFVHGWIHFRPNQYRQLKRDRHRRAVELWPPLAALLRRYLAAAGIRQGLLFPGRDGAMMRKFSAQLDRAVARARITCGRRITPHTLRHTYATMLLQTLVPTASGGWAVRSSFDVSRKLGHQKSTLVDSLYGHVVPAPRYTETLTYEPYRLQVLDADAAWDDLPIAPDDLSVPRYAAPADG
ncbi:MAG TPA: site-specific integrase [Gemmatimonadales bacterium]|nr:site-specific integrase [Gemmatimonadales bacterium]